MPEGLAMIALAIRLAPFAVAMFLGAALWHATPLVGPGARQHRLNAENATLRTDVESWRTSAGQWQASAEKSERLRKIETTQAVAAQNDAQTQCSVRVREARASAKIIKEIAYAPVKADAAGCAVRAVVSTDRLRDALQPRPGR